MSGGNSPDWDPQIVVRLEKPFDIVRSLTSRIRHVAVDDHEMWFERSYERNETVLRMVAFAGITKNDGADRIARFVARQQFFKRHPSRFLTLAYRASTNRPLLDI